MHHDFLNGWCHFLGTKSEELPIERPILCGRPNINRANVSCCRNSNVTVSNFTVCYISICYRSIDETKEQSMSPFHIFTICPIDGTIEVGLVDPTHVFVVIHYGFWTTKPFFVPLFWVR